MSKLLYITNIGGKKMTGSFSGTSIKAAQNLGIEYFQVANRSSTTDEQRRIDEAKYGVRLLHADINRSPFSPSNIKAFRQIISIIEEERIDYIHCNTPVGGVLGRLAGKKCGVKRIIYQAHGFHFFKGAPLINWLIYYPVERILAHFTDALITINQEDYKLAQKFHLKKGGKIYYVPGVGIDIGRFDKNSGDKNKKRAELGVSEDDIVLISAGELNSNKNNRVIIEALSRLRNHRIHYVVCGIGEKTEELKQLAEKQNVSGNVHFLGYRTDIIELYAAADIFVMPSFREGLSRSVMEAMAIGLPCIVSKIRGNTDLINDGIEGYTCDPNDCIEFAERIRELSDNSKLREKMGKASQLKVQKFSAEEVISELMYIYMSVFAIEDPQK